MKYFLSFLQINHYPERYKKSLQWLLRLLSTIGCLFLIVWKVDWDAFSSLEVRVSSTIVVSVSLVVLLMPVNWWLEVEKWKVSIPDEKLSIHEAARAVLVGLALNWVVPLTLGDVGGRLMNLINKKKGAVALLINRVISLGLTGVYGMCSALYYFGYLNLAHDFVFVFIGLLLGVVWWFFGNYYGVVFRRIFFISILRYFVFSFQFYVLLAAFLPELSGSTILFGVGWVFLFRSFIPALFGNFGVREASALVFFEPYLPNTEMVLVPCLFIWVINTVFPSLMGAFMIFKLRVNIAR